MRIIGLSKASTQLFLVDKAATSGHSAENVDVRARGTAHHGGLRVVRESDCAIGADCAGRMVISGRMADVCAELERMALRGTAVH